MKKTNFFVAVMCVAALIGVTAAYAGPYGWGPGGGKGAAFWNELTPDQKKEFTSLRTEFMKKQEALRSQMAQKRIELFELASKEKPDEQAVEKKRQEIWALQDTMRNEQRAFGTKIRSLLTPEQREKLGPHWTWNGYGFWRRLRYGWRPRYGHGVRRMSWNGFQVLTVALDQ